MKRVGIREFEKHIDMYIRDVERGETLSVTQGGKPIFEVHTPPSLSRGGKNHSERKRRKKQTRKRRPNTHSGAIYLRPPSKAIQREGRRLCEFFLRDRGR